MARALVVYSKRFFCPDVGQARMVIDHLGVAYREIHIEDDPQAAAKVLAWTGHYSCPTIVVAEEGSVDPAGPVEPLLPGRSPRGIDRGHLITEPNPKQLRDFLIKHGFVE
ncbi:MAG: hypothetical protein HYZ68_01625 [Chloroflexi bacterium]|nr:hypothetical protein [Chloroflexota bacterium]